MTTLIAAYVFALTTAVSVLFQIALALGAPWGYLAMGGRFPGKFPPAMRVAALAQAGVLALLAVIVATKARLVLVGFYAFSEAATWGVFAGQQRCVLARRGTWCIRRVQTTARSGCAPKLVMLIRPEGTALAKPRASRRERSER